MAVFTGMRVCKFGGTSLADAAQFRKVQSIIDADRERRFIVPSAPGKRHSKDQKITDLLYLAQRLAAAGEPLGHVWETISSRFLELERELGLHVGMAQALDEVRRRIEGGADEHYAASRGEVLNGLLVAGLLNATLVDAAEVVLFDRTGRVDPRTYTVLAQRCTGPGRYVIPGFYGSTPDGRVRTFSRGGSDISGAIVAAAMNAAVYENWTDVPGVLMTDPRIVPQAKPITEITYRELRELSYMGASVLHEEAVFPVRTKNIPINIRNTNDPDAPGTLILAERDTGHQVVAGIAGIGGFSVFNLEKALMNTETGFGRRVLDVFERLGISYEHTPTGIDTFSVVVANHQLKDQAEVILADLRAAVHPDRLEFSPGLALVATVGQGMGRRIGTAARLFKSLAAAGINIRMIDQGSSEQNIIVGVEERDLASTIRAIYDEFQGDL